MPSFDVVSEVDMHEVSNAVDQANREVNNRFDFKGTDSNFEQQGAVVALHTQNDFQLKQMLDILKTKLGKRGVDVACLEEGKPEIALNHARQDVNIRQGLDTPLAKKIVKLIKDRKLKVQAAIQGEKIRVTGKKKDDLQQVIVMLKDTDFDLPLQFINFRD